MKYFLSLLLLVPMLLPAQKDKKSRDYFQITIYHFTTPEQEKTLDEYFETALIPAFHRLETQPVGVFKPLANDTAADKTIYTLVALKSLKQVMEIRDKLWNDKALEQAGKKFTDAPYNAPAFTKKEVILLEAFPMAPALKTPVLQSPKADRVYELRSYEGASDKLHLNKVRMFNEGGEVTLFERLQFNAVFYGSVIAGCHMPNLMYMTSFENMNAREEHWKSFFSDPDWKKLSAMPEYQHNVSHNDITFMRATPYSEL